jgi:uncharacterized damage-inducible protein DinB
MGKERFQLEDVWNNLSRTPKVLRSMLEGLSGEWLHSNEGENTWSPFDVLGHLLHGEKANWVNRIRTIIQDGEKKPFAPFDRSAFLNENKHKSLGILLDEFGSIRLENIHLAQTLIKTKEDLLRIGKHPEFGTVTLQQLLATWSTHDLNHIGQIVRVMAKYYEDEIGPWKAYLGIFKAK